MCDTAEMVNDHITTKTNLEILFRSENLFILHLLHDSWLAGRTATALFTLIRSTLSAFSLSRRHWFQGSLISCRCLSTSNMQFHSLFTSNIKYADMHGSAQVDRKTNSLHIFQRNALNKMWGTERRGRERGRQNRKGKRGEDGLIKRQTKLPTLCAKAFSSSIL